MKPLPPREHVLPNGQIAGKHRFAVGIPLQAREKQQESGIPGEYAACRIHTRGPRPVCTRVRTSAGRPRAEPRASSGGSRAAGAARRHLCQAQVPSCCAGARGAAGAGARLSRRATASRPHTSAYRAGAASVRSASSVLARKRRRFRAFRLASSWACAGWRSRLIPGGLEVWQDVLARERKLPIVRMIGRGDSTPLTVRRAFSKPRWRIPAFPPSTVQTQIYLALSAIDGARPAERRLPSETARLLAAQFLNLSDSYPIFVDRFRRLTMRRSNRFIDATGRIDGISNQSLRSNTLGAFFKPRWGSGRSPGPAAANRRERFRIPRGSLNYNIRTPTNPPPTHP